MFRYALLLVVFSGQSAVSQEVISAGGKAETWSMPQALLMDAATGSTLVAEAALIVSESVDMKASAGGQAMERGSLVQPEKTIVYDDGTIIKEILPGGYRKIATGLLRPDAEGKLVPSSLTPMLKSSGGLAFPDAPLRVDIAASANRQTVVETRRHDQAISARSAVAAIAYYDAQRPSRLILANVVDAKVEAHATGAVFYDAFDHVDADILYTIHPWGLEQDVVIYGGLPTPEAVGLQPETTYLCVLTELLDVGNNPQLVQRKGEKEPDDAGMAPLHVYKMVNDEPVRIHDFQSGVAYEHQTALSVGGLAKSSEPVTVRHRIFQDQGRWFLSEEVAVSDIQQHTPDIFKPEASMKTVESLPATRPESIADTDAEWMRAQEPLLAYQPRQREAFVIDYLDYSGTTSNNIVFATGETYFIPSDLVINGASLTIMPGAIVKFATNATIKLINGATIINKSHLLDPAIFTSAHDTQFGEAIPGYTNPPANHLYASAFELENWNAVTIEGIRIRYASTGIKAETSGHTIRHSLIEKGWQGIDIHSASTGGAVTVRNVLFSHLNRGLTAGSQNSNVTVYLYNSTMHAVSEYGVATNTKVNQFSIQCSLFTSVTNELSKGSPVSGMGGSGNFVYNSPTQGLGSVTVLTNNPFLTGTYGSNYLVQSSALINGGYISSDYWLLFHFTTATNHAKESNTVVDVGFHYPSPADTDGDGLYDFVEDASGNGTYTSNSVDVADLNAYDTDGDGLNDYDEYMVHGTNPKSYDTDGDGFDDAHELSVGSDPLSATSYPVRISGPITYSGGQTGSLHIAIRSFEPVPYPSAFYMPFTTNEGSMVHDRSGRGNTGTVQGATWSSAGIKGGAYSFDGDDRILVGDLAVVEGQTNVTFGAWIKRTGGSSLNGIMGKTVAENESMYLLLNSGGAGGVAYVVPQSKSLESYAEKSPIVTNHHWMHLAGVYSGTNMRLYANGQCVATGATHALEAVRSNTVTAAIGDVASDRGWFFAGLIDEVTIYQHALSDALVKAMAQDAQAGLVNRQAASNGVPASYSTPEVPSGSNYWVVAWIDTNGNGDREYWEPYGAYTSNPVMANGPVSGAAITVLDPDADGDGAADWREVLLGTDPFNKDSYPTTIAGTVIYTGGQTGPVRVVATGTNYVPFTAVIAAPGAYTISNVPNQRTYTVSAFRDSNTNGVMEYAEAQGTYSNNPITLLSATTNISITLTEADTDGDGMPDWWEIFYGLNPTSGVHASQVGWWKFDDATGTNALNSARTNYHGQLVNMPTSSWINGKLGKALQFDGSNDYVRVPQSPVLITGQQFTVSAWTYLDSNTTSAYATIISDFDNCSYNYKGFWTGWDYFSGGGGAFLEDCSGEFSWPLDATPITGAWHHIVVTHSGTTTRVYKNGVEIANDSGPFAPALQSELRIGWANDPDYSYFWKGKLDDVRLYSTALSSNTVHRMYDAFNDPDVDGLTNLDEYQNDTNPNDADTDDDGLSDQEEVLIHGTNPASADSDGDGLSDYDEVTEHLTNPNNWDSDGDGIDDGNELAYGLNPTNYPGSAGINSNWVYHSRSRNVMATWEHVPDRWERFLMVDYETGTNTAFIIMPPRLGLKANSTTQMFMRFSWTTNGVTWTNTEHSGSFYSNVVVASTNAFHGLPTMGQVTLPVFRFDWAIPPQATNNYVNAYYAPFARVLTNGHQSGYLWIIDKIPEAGNGYGYNNYLTSPQAVGPQFGGVDYRLDLDKTRFRNGGLELGTTLYHTNEPNWGGFGLDGGMSTSIVHGGSRSFVARDLDGIYQRVVVHAGEELVLGGWMYSPSSTNALDTNSLSGDRYAVISIEYYDAIDGHNTRTDAARMSSDHAKDTWLYYSITSLVPHRAAYAQVSLRTVAPTVNLVPPGHVYFDDVSLVVNKDSDRDGMPDRWEMLWPSSTSTNNPHDAIVDSDGDGLSNIEEYRIGTDPTNEDTDEDGIPDRWEYIKGLNPHDESDALLDSDGDGLSNLVEYEYGTDPSSKDTDRDGLDDVVEIYDFLSDPLTPNFPGYSAHYEIPGTATVNRLGTWMENGNYLCSDALRGSVWYQISIPTADVYQVELEASDCEAWKTRNSYELRASLNDSLLGRKTLSTGTNGVGVATYFTPWLTAGVYTVRFEWDNASDSQRLNVRHVRWGTLNGIDSNSDGKKDWVTNRISRLSGLDNTVISSATSPACVEGRDPFVDFMTIDGGINPSAGINGRWYADVPLNISNSISRQFAFQHGGLITTCQLTWSATKILTTTGTVAMRLGDALKLSAFPSAVTSGTHDIIIGGSSNYIGISAGTYIAHAFNATGTFSVSGTYHPASGPTMVGGFTVTVYSASFNDSPACWHLVRRTWLCPEVPSNATLESGVDLFISEEMNSSPRAFNLTAHTPDNHGIVARLGSSGPIMASATARGFRFGADADTGFQTLGVCNTGVTMYENQFVFSPVLDDITIQGKIFIGGLFYEDGSITNYWTPDQFDDVGVLNVRYLKDTPGALCSDKLLYQGTNLIGRHSRP